MADAVLTINAGSSSLKFSVYQIGEDDRPSAGGQGPDRGHRHLAALRRRGRRQAELLVERRWPGRSRSGPRRVLPRDRRLAARAVRQAASCSASATGWCTAASTIAAPVLIEAAVVDKLEALCPLAPLHQPHNLAGIRAVAAAAAGAAAGRLLRYRLPPRPPRGRRLVRPAAPVLRRGHPPLRLPRPVLRVHRRARCPRSAPEIADGRVVVAHLGSGASMCALRAGRSVDSTMGFTALDGLPMGTRCGALDPGVVLHLIRAHRHGRRRDRAPALPRLRAQGRVGDQQRHARPAGERRPARRAGDRAVRLADRSRARRARRRARRPRRPRVHRRDRRALGRDPRAGLRAAPPGSASSSIAAANRGRRPADLEPRPAGSRSTRSRPTRSR